MRVLFGHIWGGGTDHLASAATLPNQVHSMSSMRTRCGAYCRLANGGAASPHPIGAYRVQGLLVLHSDGSLETLFSRADDANLMLGNDLVVDPADGSVYFTNTHNVFEVRSVAFVGVGVVAISSRSCALFPGLQRRTIGYAYLENSPRGSVWRYAARLPFTAACVADNMDCAATTRPQALLQSSSPM